VVEEAQRISVRGQEVGILEKVFREGRKMGISTVAIYQDPSSIPLSLLNNASTLIIFQTLEESSLNYVTRLTSLSVGEEKKLKKVLSSLRSGEALIKDLRGGLSIIELNIYGKEVYKLITE